MFEKLRRAKSFIVRTKTKEELDLSESSHLRRAAINNTVLNRQRKLGKPGGAMPERSGPGKLPKKMSASHEVIYDDKIILDQIRRINFGVNKPKENKDVKTRASGTDKNNESDHLRDVRRRHSANGTKISFLNKEGFQGSTKAPTKRT